MKSKNLPQSRHSNFSLIKKHPKPPKYFNVGLRLGQVLKARLRMEFSALNADFYRKKYYQQPFMSMWWL